MVLQDLSPRRRELAALGLRMDELREEIANLEAEMERLSAACRAPGAPASFGLRISLIAEGLATKRARLGELTRRARAIEADIAAHPSGVYPSITQPAEASVSDATPPPVHADSSEPSVAGPTPPPASAGAVETLEPAPRQPAPTAQSPTEPSAPILSENVVQTPESESAVGMSRPGEDSSPARRGLVWVFAAATVVVLSLLIAGLLADVRRAPRSPQPGSSGTAPALLGGQGTPTLVASSAH